MKCPSCGKPNRPGVLLCEHCHENLYASLLEQVSTKQLDKNRERALKIDKTMPSSNPIVLYVSNAPEPVAVARVGKVTVGRLDPTNETTPPDVELEAFDAAELGVSRHHMEINAEVQPPTITDLDSSNGTFLNGEKLQPGKVYPVESSDEIRLGRLVLRMFY